MEANGQTVFLIVEQGLSKDISNCFRTKEAAVNELCERVKKMSDFYYLNCKIIERTIE